MTAACPQALELLRTEPGNLPAHRQAISVAFGVDMKNKAFGVTPTLVWLYGSIERTKLAPPHGTTQKNDD